MRAELSDDEMSFYAANGFVAIADLLDAAELAHWRTVVDDAVDAGLAEQPPGSNPHVFTQRMNLRRFSEPVRDLVADPRLGRLVADLEDLDAVRIYLDQVLIKEPFAIATAYHQDLPWWAFDSDRSCTIWIALDEASVENGCLYFVPGSHRLGIDHRSTSVGADLGAVFAGHPEATARWPVACPIPAGGCTVHNAQTIHGAGANMTPGRRRAVTVALMPDDVAYDGTRDARSQEAVHLDGLVVGQRLASSEHNPIVFTRSPL